MVADHDDAGRFDLKRFESAQQPVYETVLDELRNGKKRTHWMWFVFPQFIGLGRSDTAIFYAIRSIEEARAYHADEILGSRLRECTTAMLQHRERSATDILGTPDDLKFHSSMTLFSHVSGAEVFHCALALYFDGRSDSRTLALIENHSEKL